MLAASTRAIRTRKRALGSEPIPANSASTLRARLSCELWASSGFASNLAEFVIFGWRRDSLLREAHLNMRTLIAATALFAVALSTQAMAWDLLGSRDVRDAVDRDVIVVEGSRQFERIRLCAYERPVHLIDLDVRYANGGHQDVSVRSRLQPGGCTRDIDLVGDDRNIASVQMVYEANTRRRGVHATVRLFGE